MENSVAFYRMQSMNQSLIALLAHSMITYDQAIEASLDPDDLSLKLRQDVSGHRGTVQGG